MELFGTTLKFQQVNLVFIGFDIALIQPCLRLSLVQCLPLPLEKCYLIGGKRALRARHLRLEAVAYLSGDCQVTARYWRAS